MSDEVAIDIKAIEAEVGRARLFPEVYDLGEHVLTLTRLVRLLSGTMSDMCACMDMAERSASCSSTACDVRLLMHRIGLWKLPPLGMHGDIDSRADQDCVAVMRLEDE